MTAERYPYQPDYAVPPGRTLAESLQALGMSRLELAVHTGLTSRTIQRLMNGKARVTPEIARLLERVTGLPARTWLNLESNYREQLANLKG